MAETQAPVARLSRAGVADPPGKASTVSVGEMPADPTLEVPAHGGAADVQPSLEELRISARLLLHIARQPRYDPGELLPKSLTQSEMAKALGASQGAVSNSLRRLVYGGLLQVERSHVRAMIRRVKVYQLTPRGEEAVRQFRERFDRS
jgi:DNA-binding PadR family transcriptional regulator